MELFQALGLSFTILYTLWIFCYSLLIFMNRKTEPIRFRNPALLLLTSVSSLLVKDIMILNACFLPISCFLQRNSRMIVPSLVIMPCVLRGIQYKVLINESYRRKFPIFKSDIFSFCCNIIFFILHTAFRKSLNLQISVNRNGCGFPTKQSFIFGFIVLICLLVATYRVFLLIPWSYDSFYVGQDLKRCSLIWVVSIVIFALLGNQKLGSYFLNWVYLIGVAGSFFVSVVCPINKFVFHHSGWYNENERDQMQRKKYIQRRRVGATQVAPAPQNMEKFMDELHDYVQQSFSMQIKVIEMILENNQATKELHEYSNRRFCNETTLFLEQAYRHKCLWMTESKKQSLLKGKYIIEDFIQPKGPNCIDVSAELRKSILEHANHWNKCNFQDKFPQDIFDKGYEEMCKLFFANLNTSEEIYTFWQICIEHLDVETLGQLFMGLF